MDDFGFVHATFYPKAVMFQFGQAMPTDSHLIAWWH